MFCGISSSLLKFSLITRGGSDLQWENTSSLRTLVEYKHGRNLSVKLISFIHFLKDCIYSVKEFGTISSYSPLYPSYSSLFYSFILFKPHCQFFFEIVFMMNYGTNGIRGRRGLLSHFSYVQLFVTAWILAHYDKGRDGWMASLTRWT